MPDTHRMRSRSVWYRRARARHCIALLLAAAILLAGIAQAAHFHKDALARGGTDPSCLLCTYAGGCAALPAQVHVAQPPPPWSHPYRFPGTVSVLSSPYAASYEARGPPVA